MGFTEKTQDPKGSQNEFEPVDLGNCRIHKQALIQKVLFGRMSKNLNFENKVKYEEKLVLSWNGNNKNKLFGKMSCIEIKSVQNKEN